METVKLLVHGVEVVVHHVTLVPHDGRLQDKTTLSILFKHGRVQGHGGVWKQDLTNE